MGEGGMKFKTTTYIKLLWQYWFGVAYIDTGFIFGPPYLILHIYTLHEFLYRRHRELLEERVGTEAFLNMTMAEIKKQKV